MGVHLQLLVGRGGQRDAAISFAHQHVVLEVSAGRSVRRASRRARCKPAHASMWCWAAAETMKPSPVAAAVAALALTRESAMAE